MDAMSASQASIVAVVAFVTLTQPGHVAKKHLPTGRSDLWIQCWSNGSGFNDCFSRKALRSAEKHSIEPS